MKKVVISLFLCAFYMSGLFAEDVEKKAHVPRGRCSYFEVDREETPPVSYEDCYLTFLHKKIKSLKSLKKFYGMKANGYRRLAKFYRHQIFPESHRYSKNLWKQAVDYDRIVRRIGKEIRGLKHEELKVRIDIEERIGFY